MKFDYLKSNGFNCLFLVNCEVKNNILKAVFVYFPPRINNEKIIVRNRKNILTIVIPPKYLNLKSLVFDLNLELKII